MHSVISKISLLSVYSISVKNGIMSNEMIKLYENSSSMKLIYEETYLKISILWEYGHL